MRGKIIKSLEVTHEARACATVVTLSLSLRHQWRPAVGVDAPTPTVDFLLTGTVGAH